MIAPDVADADEAYRQVTVEDGGVAVGRYFRITEDDGWWWRRRPAFGPLADYLDSAE